MTPYSLLAHEYYDATLHPTCANFDALSRRFLEPIISELIGASNAILETGTGRSVVAPLLKKADADCELILLDSSREMLLNSSPWAEIAKFVVADSRSTGLGSEKFDLVVSSLGDPYNTQEFWAEVSRLLRNGGICLFTAPAPEWALQFREFTDRAQAEFVRADGMTVKVPSFVPTMPQQMSLFRNAGLQVLGVEQFTLADIQEPVSPKLKIQATESDGLIVLRGFKLSKLCC